MREELNDSITKTVVNFVTQLHETEDEFIFETISPFCTDILHRRICVSVYLLVIGIQTEQKSEKLYLNTYIF